eukprot:gene31781-54145_t
MNAAQLLGLADAMLEQAVEYAKIRTQFGQPVGAFQALKHQLASCAVAVEFAKPVVWRAAAAMQDGLETAPVHVSHAKIAASDAAMLTAETAIQVHGAMGYTYEVDLHFWMKRTWALVGGWGDRSYHYKRLDEAVLGGSFPIGNKMAEAYIIDAVRTPIGRKKGTLAELHPADLGAAPIKALVERTGIDAGAVDDVDWGCCDTIGPQAGANGRTVWLGAGLPPH